MIEAGASWAVLAFKGGGSTARECPRAPDITLVSKTLLNRKRSRKRQRRGKG